MRELQLIRAGRLAWADRPEPQLTDPGDAIVRPFIAGRCDGDTVPIHRPVSRAMQVAIKLGAIDPVVGCICGRVPFKGPFAIGHECIAEVTAVVRTFATCRSATGSWCRGQSLAAPAVRAGAV